MSNDAVQRAVNAAGGQAGLARAVGVSQPSVWHWLRKAQRVPAEFVLPIEAATGISRHDLWPDIYPVEAAPAEQAA